MASLELGQFSASDEITGPPRGDMVYPQGKQYERRSHIEFPLS